MSAELQDVTGQDARTSVTVTLKLSAFIDAWERTYGPDRPVPDDMRAYAIEQIASSPAATECQLNVTETSPLSPSQKLALHRAMHAMPFGSNHALMSISRQPDVSVEQVVAYLTTLAEVLNNYIAGVDNDRAHLVQLVSDVAGLRRLIGVEA